MDTSSTWYSILSQSKGRHKDGLLLVNITCKCQRLHLPPLKQGTPPAEEEKKGKKRHIGFTDISISSVTDARKKMSSGVERMEVG